jgi:hypothetical protein
MIILKCIFKKLVAGAWSGLISLRIGKVVNSCEAGNGLSASIECGEMSRRATELLASQIDSASWG